MWNYIFIVEYDEINVEFETCFIEKLFVADIAISIFERGLLVSFAQLTLVNFRFYVQVTILDIKRILK